MHAARTRMQVYVLREYLEREFREGCDYSLVG